MFHVKHFPNLSNSGNLFERSYRHAALKLDHSKEANLNAEVAKKNKGVEKTEPQSRPEMHVGLALKPSVDSSV
jgi:hypothetical protein